MADVRCTHCDQRNLMWHQKPNGSWVLVVVHTCQGGPMRPAPPHPQSTARAVDK